MVLHLFEQVEEEDDYFGFDEITFERIYSRRDRRHSYTRRVEELGNEAVLRTRRQVATAQNGEITADVRRALAASGLDGRMVGVNLGVTTLTAFRAKAILEQTYAHHYSRAEGVKRFNRIVRQKSQDFNKSNPRPEIVLGSISIYGPKNRNQLTYPVGLHCQVEDPTGKLTSEYQQMVTALSYDSRRPIKLSPVVPHITLATFPNRIIAERFANRLDTINDVAALSGRVIILDQVQTKSVPID